MKTVASLSDFLLFPKKRRVAFVEQSIYRSRKYTYEDVTIGMRRLAFAMDSAGLREGDRVVLWGENSARWAMTFYACLLSRIVVVPIDAGFSADFVQKIRDLTEAKMVLSDHASSEWESLLNSSGESIVWPDAPPEEKTLLQIIFTSGTTGDPKGVMITHGNVLSNLIPIQNEYQKYKKYAKPFSPLRFVHIIPLSHLFGQIMGLFIPQMVEGTVIFTEQSAPQIIRAVKSNRASTLICVPRQLSMLSSYIRKKHPGVVPERQKKGITGTALRWWKSRSIHREFGWKFWAFISGGAALPVEEQNYWKDHGFAVLQGYGLTETAPSITITHPFKKMESGTVGKKLPSVEVKIAEDGEILVKGPNVTSGYFRNEQATRELLSDGWLHTGDLGRFDQDGNLQILGRKKDVIVTAEGLNVYPQDVEAVLNQDRRVRDSAVIAQRTTQDPQIHAVLLLASEQAGKELEDIVSGANRKLERFQRIQSYSIWPDRELPRTSTGKLKRAMIATGTPSESTEERDIDKLVSQLLHSGPGLNLDGDLGLSSLDRVELLVALESAAGVEVDEAAFAKARTIRDVSSLVGATQEKITQHYPYWRWPQWPPVKWFRNLCWYTLVFPLMPIRMKVVYSGRENLIGAKMPLLFVANHQSILDVPAILRSMPMRYRNLLAPAMGIGGTGIRRFAAALFFAAYPLPQTSIGLRQALQHTGHLADRGYNPLVFPEGARTLDGNLSAFRPGVGVIVEKTKLPVLPIIIRGAFEIWPVTARGPGRKGTIHVHFGPVMNFSGKQPAQITSELESWFRLTAEKQRSAE